MDPFDLWCLLCLPLMAAMKFCCPRCDTPPPDECLVCEDGFDGAGTCDGFTDTAGTWNETGGTANVSSTNARRTCDTNSPSASRVIKVDLSSTNSSNILYVWVGDCRVEVRIGSGRLRILDSGGTAVDSTLDSFTLATATFHSLWICYDADTDILEAEIESVSNSYVAASLAISDLTNGIGTGGTLTGSASFDNWELRLLSEDPVCPCPVDPSGGSHTCIYCEDNTSPYAWLIEIEGVVDGACTNCTAFNGAFVATPASTVLGSSPCLSTDDEVCCCWQTPDLGTVVCPGPDIDLTGITLGICPPRGGNPDCIRVLSSNGGATILWQLDEADPHECIGRVESIPFSSDGTSCDASSSTCTITAL